uniref:Cytosolic fatty-acid binding proteins domain-containing protein n=1 Tax=Bubo bubo TaxID=30461 RepID=A0A8C0I924_BUBBB
MPNFSGNWKMKSSENFEELLKALGECEPPPKKISHPPP